MGSIWFMDHSPLLIAQIDLPTKKGIRAVIPGFINYRYKDGVIPGHTKSYFHKCKILTVHGKTDEWLNENVILCNISKTPYRSMIDCTECST